MIRRSQAASLCRAPRRRSQGRPSRTGSRLARGSTRGRHRSPRSSGHERCSRASPHSSTFRPPDVHQRRPLTKTKSSGSRAAPCPARDQCGATGNRIVLHRTRKRAVDLGFGQCPRQESDESDEAVDRDRAGRGYLPTRSLSAIPSPRPNTRLLMEPTQQWTLMGRWSDLASRCLNQAPVGEGEAHPAGATMGGTLA
jgi:hypothetical protein